MKRLVLKLMAALSLAICTAWPQAHANALPPANARVLSYALANRGSRAHGGSPSAGQKPCHSASDRTTITHQASTPAQG